MGQSTGMFFEMHEGSISTWITLACGAQASSLPVTRSSNRAPTAMRRSQFWTAWFAYHVPCMPSMPSESGSSSGKEPSPCSVVVTGIFVFRAISVSSDVAFAPIVPPPT